MNSSLKAAALRYAAQGWPVFLLGRSKRPVANCAACSAAELGHDREACRCLTCHGLYAATLEPKRIAAMFAVVPTPMLAIRTGLASRLVVVDVDPGHGGQESLTGLMKQGLCPPTAWVRTGSGGLHLFYRHPGGKVACSQSRLGPGIDVRGDGGYVVAAPSVHPRTRKPYGWGASREVAEMPSALADACQPPSQNFPAGPVSSTRLAANLAGGGITSPQRLLDTLVATVTHATEGKRRTVLYGASRGVARMVAAGAISHTDAVSALTGAGRTAQQTERDIRKAITDAFRAEGVAA